MNLDPAAFIFCNSSPYPLRPFALPDILDSFQMAMYKIFPWCILVSKRFHETMTSKITRTMTIKAFWHNVLFVMFAHIHFAPCDVCACCCYDKWTAQRVFIYSHWSDDVLHKQDKNKHLDKSSIRFLPNFSLSYFHILCSNRSSFQFWQTQHKLKTNLVFGQSPLSTESEFSCLADIP